MPARYIDAAAYIAKLGLKPADARPILEGFRQAHAEWRRERLQRIAEHGRRVEAHLRRFPKPAPRLAASSRGKMGRPRAVRCVELRRHFRTLTEAAAFVGRKASNISQSLLRGVRCGAYHWEEFDSEKHLAG
jgi:hypothetical protein